MATWTNLPVIRRALAFVGALTAGCLVWWYVAPFLLFPVLRLIVETIAQAFTRGTLSAIVPNGDQWTLNTQLLRPGSLRDLFDLPLEPRQFTLALPLVWAFSTTFPSARRLLPVVLSSTLIALVPMTAALLLQVGATIPKFAINAKVVQYLGADAFGRPGIQPYTPPNLALLATADTVRVVIVYINLFIVPVIVPAWLAAHFREPKPNMPDSRIEKKRSKRQQKRRKGTRR